MSCTPCSRFQHLTSDCVNEQQLWDDTLFMTFLMLTELVQDDMRME